MQTGNNGISLIAKFEGLELEAYPDPGTGGDPWTIGYGHTKGVCKGDTCSKEEALVYLKLDLNDAESAVNKLVKVELTQNQFDALVSFVFNLGSGNFSKSTLLKHINNSKFTTAAEEFKKWDKAAGRVLLGLTKRRLAETNLFKL